MEDSGGAVGGSSSSSPVGGSEVDQTTTKKKKKPEVENKSKRQLKTAAQLEALEKTYAEEAYPSEALRAELSAQLGLSDRQLKMWFCHRRLKDRNRNRQHKDSPAAATAPPGEEMESAVEARRKQLPSSASRSNSFDTDPRHLAVRTPPDMAVRRSNGDLSTVERYYEPTVERYYEPRHSAAELRAMAFVEEQLEEAFREDGPVLGVEFDTLPPDAFAAPMRRTAAVVMHQKVSRHFEANMYAQYDLKPIKSNWLPRDDLSSRRKSSFKQQTETLNTNYEPYHEGSQSDS